MGVGVCVCVCACFAPARDQIFSSTRTRTDDALPVITAVRMPVHSRVGERNASRVM